MRSARIMLAVIFCCALAAPEAGGQGGKKVPGGARVKAGKAGRSGMAGKAVEKVRYAYRAGDFVFLKMPEAVSESLRPSLAAEDVPEEVAVISGVSCRRLDTMIKTGYNVITTLDDEGATSEAMLSEDSIVLLRKLGAEADEHGVSARGYLRLPADPYGLTSKLVIEVMWPERRTYVFKVVKLKKKKARKAKKAAPAAGEAEEAEDAAD